MMGLSTGEAIAQRAPFLLPEASGFEPADLPGLRKAAILLVALGDDLAKTLFQSLAEADIHRVRMRSQSWARFRRTC
jgi:hypothetical protein